MGRVLSRTGLREALRADLAAAMKARDRDAAAALRTVLGAIDNSGAVAVEPPAGPAAADGPVVTSGRGAGSTEAPRRELGEADLRDIVRGHVEECLREAERDETLGRPAAAEQLRREAGILAPYLT